MYNNHDDVSFTKAITFVLLLYLFSLDGLPVISCPPLNLNTLVNTNMFMTLHSFTEQVMTIYRVYE